MHLIEMKPACSRARAQEREREKEGERPTWIAAARAFPLSPAPLYNRSVAFSIGGHYTQLAAYIMHPIYHSEACTSGGERGKGNAAAATTL